MRGGEVTLSGGTTKTGMVISTDDMQLTLDEELSGGVRNPIIPSWVPDIELLFNYYGALAFPALELAINLVLPFDELLAEIDKGYFSLGIEVSNASGADFYLASFKSAVPPTASISKLSVIVLMGLGLTGIAFVCRCRQNT